MGPVAGGHRNAVVCFVVMDTVRRAGLTMKAIHRLTSLITLITILSLLLGVQLFHGVSLPATATSSAPTRFSAARKSDTFHRWPEENNLAAMSKVEHAVSKRMCGVGIIICGFLLLAVALIMGLEFPKFVYQKNLKDLCILDTNHRLYEYWVKDAFRDKYNRLYYWELTNKDDFLYSGALPTIRERGPYVYREYEQKHDVRFAYSSVDFYLRRWQVFNEQLTRAECGDNCTELDQITILNPQYLTQVGKYGSDTNYALLYVPEVVDTTLLEVTLLTNTNFTGAMAIFGQANSTTLDSIIVDLGYPIAFTNLGFGTWLGMKDTDYKKAVHNYRGSQDFSAKEMAGLFTVLKNSALLGATQDLLSRTSYVTECDVNANVPRFFSNQEQQLDAGVLQYETKPPACSFLACLSKYRELQKQTLNVVRYVTNVTDCIARYLCLNNATACFLLPANPYYQKAYIFVIHEYITVHWTRYAFYKRVYSQNKDLVVTKPQAQLALGYYLVNVSDFDGDSRDYFVPGLVEHTDLVADMRWRSKKLSLYNCYDTTEASTNFFWKALDGRVFVPEDQFPNASAVERRLYSFRRNLPPRKKLVACEDTVLKQDSFHFYLPQFWRKLEFWLGDLKYIGEKIVNVISVNRSMFDVDDVYVSEPGLQSMRGTYGYLSWISLPHFLYAEDSGLVEQFSTRPDEEKHNLQMSVEPVTGAVWEQAIRYQLNVGLLPEYAGVRRPRNIRVRSAGRPLPVYWVDSIFTYNLAGQAEYDDRSGRLMRAACGGLIGMSFIASFTVIFGIMGATIRIRSGRVAPAEVTDGL